MNNFLKTQFDFANQNPLKTEGKGQKGRVKRNKRKN